MYNIVYITGNIHRMLVCLFNEHLAQKENISYWGGGAVSICSMHILSPLFQNTLSVFPENELGMPMLSSPIVIWQSFSHVYKCAYMYIFKKSYFPKHNPRSWH